ncbi:hypothetical protein DITRI_Ditri16bG0112500 [Diplodiscus trichospermus]
METSSENSNSIDMILLFHSFICYNSFKSFFSRYWSFPQFQHEHGSSKTSGWEINQHSDCSRKEVISSADDQKREDGGRVCKKEEEPSLEEVKQAFDVFDVNKDGFIDAEELQRVLCILGLKEGLKMENCIKMIKTFDKNGDDRIDFQEFVKFMENSFC